MDGDNCGDHDNDTTEKQAESGFGATDDQVNEGGQRSRQPEPVGEDNKKEVAEKGSSQNETVKEGKGEELNGQRGGPGGNVHEGEEGQKGEEGDKQEQVVNKEEGKGTVGGKNDRRNNHGDNDTGGNHKADLKCEDRFRNSLHGRQHANIRDVIDSNLIIENYNLDVIRDITQNDKKGKKNAEIELSEVTIAPEFENPSEGRAYVNEFCDQLLLKNILVLSGADDNLLNDAGCLIADAVRETKGCDTCYLFLDTSECDAGIEEFTVKDIVSSEKDNCQNKVLIVSSSIKIPTQQSEFDHQAELLRKKNIYLIIIVNSSILKAVGSPLTSNIDLLPILLIKHSTSISDYVLFSNKIRSLFSKKIKKINEYDLCFFVRKILNDYSSSEELTLEEFFEKKVDEVISRYLINDILPTPKSNEDIVIHIICFWLSYVKHQGVSDFKSSIESLLESYNDERKIFLRNEENRNDDDDQHETIYYSLMDVWSANEISLLKKANLTTIRNSVGEEFVAFTTHYQGDLWQGYFQSNRFEKIDYLNRVFEQNLLFSVPRDSVDQVAALYMEMILLDYAAFKTRGVHVILKRCIELAGTAREGAAVSRLCILLKHFAEAGCVNSRGAIDQIRHHLLAAKAYGVMLRAVELLSCDGYFDCMPWVKQLIAQVDFGERGRVEWQVCRCLVIRTIRHPDGPCQTLRAIAEWLPETGSRMNGTGRLQNFAVYFFNYYAMLSVVFCFDKKVYEKQLIYPLMIFFSEDKDLVFSRKILSALLLCPEGVDNRYYMFSGLDDNAPYDYLKPYLEVDTHSYFRLYVWQILLWIVDDLLIASSFFKSMGVYWNEVLDVNQGNMRDILGVNNNIRIVFILTCFSIVINNDTNNRSISYDISSAEKVIFDSLSMILTKKMHFKVLNQVLAHIESYEVIRGWLLFRRSDDDSKIFYSILDEYFDKINGNSRMMIKSDLRNMDRVQLRVIKKSITFLRRKLKKMKIK